MILFMLMAGIKDSKNLLAALFVVAVGLGLIFNFAQPVLSSVHNAIEITLFDHLHGAEGALEKHHGHLPHTHTHTHSDGTTHQHEQHDVHCVKIGFNTSICTPSSSMEPIQSWSPISRHSTTSQFVVSAHYSELLRPPILA